MHAGLPHKDDSRPSPPLRASPANSYTAGQPSHTQVPPLHSRLIIWVKLFLTACLLHSLATCDLQLSKLPKLCQGVVVQLQQMLQLGILRFDRQYPGIRWCYLSVFVLGHYCTAHELASNHQTLHTSCISTTACFVIVVCPVMVLCD